MTGFTLATICSPQSSAYLQYSAVQCRTVQYSTSGGGNTYLYSPPILASSLKGAWERYGTFFSFFSSAM